MKKVLLGLFALSSIAIADNAYIKMGFEIAPKVTVVKDQDGIAMNKKSNSGVKNEFAFESAYDITDNLELGFGIANQYHKKTKGSGEPNSINLKMKMNSVPIYAMAKYNLPVETETYNIPYVFLNLGYSLNHGNCKIDDNLKFKYENGMYYGVGIGIDNGFIMELAYKVNQGKLRATQSRKEETHKFDYGRITFGIGVRIPSN